MRILYFLTLFIISFNSYGKSIFGKVVLLPVESQNVKDRIYIQDELIDYINSHNFESQYNQELNETLVELFYDLKPIEYKKALNRVIIKTKTDLFFRIQIKNLNEGQKQLYFTVLNNEGNKIFQRESSFTYSKASQFVSRVETWIEEFQDILPPVGEIVGLEDGKIKIRMIHQSSREDFTGRSFSLGQFQYNALGSDSYEKMGAVVERKKGYYYGYIYESHRDKDHNIGDYIILLEEGINDTLSFREKLYVSETWFNYINSPKFSLLDCSLLPLIGNTKYRTNIFDTVLEKIQEDKMCKYREDKKLNVMLEKYGKKLNQHLKDERVLKNISQVLRVGALFRIGVYKILNGVSIAFDVVSENGKNIYFSKYSVIEKADPDYIAELVLGWVREYKNTLPLSGKVVQVIDNKVVVDIPSTLVDGLEQDFQIIRPISLKYEDIKGQRKVSWKKKTLAYGVVTGIHKNHAIGNIWKFIDKTAKIKAGDWVLLKSNKVVRDNIMVFKKHNIKGQRNIGVIKANAELAQISADNSATESIYNAGVGIEFYLPFGGIILGESSRNFTGSDDSISNNNFSLALGYSFTPRLLTYFSFVDVYVGKRNVNYKIGGLEQIGVGNLKFEGFFFGAKLEIPIYKKFHLQLGGSYAPDDTAENDDPGKLFGKVESSTAYGINFIGKYKLKKGHNIYIEYNKYTYTSRYNSTTDNVTLDISSNLVRLGYSIDF